MRHRIFDVKHIELVGGPPADHLGVVVGHLDVFQEMHSMFEREIPGPLSWDLAVTTPKLVLNLVTGAPYTVTLWTAEEWHFSGDAFLLRTELQHHHFTGAGHLEGFDPKVHFG